MKDKMFNEVHLEGLLYDHDLEVKVTGDTSQNPGTEYIRGTVWVATDKEMTNIVPVYYTYVVPLTSKGNKNSLHGFLNNIVNGNLPYVMDGKSTPEEATKVRLDPALALNEWFDKRTDELISVLRCEGGFGKVINNFSSEKDEDRTKFIADILITKAITKEEDTEKGLPEQMELDGYIFNFRKDIMPVKFTMQNKKGIDYVEGMDVSRSNPLFTKAWGKVVTQVTKQEQVTENAFGEDEVTYIESTRKLFLITGMAKEPYEWDDSEFLAAIEVKEMLSERETMLAEKLANQKKYSENGNKSKIKVKNDDDDIFEF